MQASMLNCLNYIMMIHWYIIDARDSCYDFVENSLFQQKLFWRNHKKKTQRHWVQSNNKYQQDQGDQCRSLGFKFWLWGHYYYVW